MQRYLESSLKRDLRKKMVFLVGPRQAGKTTLSQALIASLGAGQYLSYDVLEDRAVILSRQWDRRTRLLVFDEIHKMPQWKSWLKGIYDGKLSQQQILVTGSARLDTFRQSGDSLAGRFFALRLHPISVREWCAHTGASADVALNHLLERGGFPEPCLAEALEDANRWRRQYFDGLIRNDVLEFSRVHELSAMRLFVELLRERVGTPLSLASIARDLHVAPTTLKRYLNILESLYIVFTVRPWHRNIARAIQQSAKVYFYDVGLVKGDAGLRFENLVATALLKHIEYLQDVEGKDVSLHYIRTKDEVEVDFALSNADQLSDLLECKISDAKPTRALIRFAEQFPGAKATQLVRDLRTEREAGSVQIAMAANWLSKLAA